MGGSWRGLVVVWAVVVSGAISGSIINEREEHELRQDIDGGNVTLDDENSRDERVFLIFAKVQPVQCSTNNTAQTDGTCMTSSDCSSRGGTPSGSCANKLGVCCIITRSCNGETTLNNTYFTEPGSSSSTLGACSLTVNRINSNICQLRLDFIKLDLSQPDVDGVCINDFMSISGGMSQVPTVCGTITGQHMYYDLDPNGGAIKVTIDRALTSSLTATWSIKVAQIPCDSKYRAPVGCLQFYTETTNIVKSFNFDGVANLNDTRQLASMEYGVCIRRADNYCGITWTANTATDLQYSFTMSENAAVVDQTLIGTSYASSRGDQCTTDFVVIPGGLYRTEANGNMLNDADRYCGLGFPESVTTTSQPFTLYVKTDANETMDRGNRGFSLTYRQTTCS